MGQDECLEVLRKNNRFMRVKEVAIEAKNNYGVACQSLRKLEKRDRATKKTKEVFDNGRRHLVNFYKVRRIKNEIQKETSCY